MLVHYTKFPEAVGAWMDEAVFPKSQKWQIVVLTLGLLRYRDRIAEYFRMYADGQGNVNTEQLKHDLELALDKVGGSFEIPYLGWNMNKEDIDVLLRHAESFGSAK